MARVRNTHFFPVRVVDVGTILGGCFGRPEVDAAEKVGGTDYGWDQLCGCVEVVDAADIIPRDDELNSRGDDGRGHEIGDCTKLL